VRGRRVLNQSREPPTARQEDRTPQFEICDGKPVEQPPYFGWRVPLSTAISANTTATSNLPVKQAVAIEQAEH